MRGWPTGDQTTTGQSPASLYPRTHQAGAARKVATPWAIWQDLVDDTASPAAIRASSASSTSCAARRRQKPRAVIVTAPGEEAQVDYGEGPMVRDPQSGKYRRTRLFVLTLGYSRKCVRLIRLQFQHAHLGRTARDGLPPTGRRRRVRRARQPARRRAEAGHLRSHHQPALSRHAGALPRRGAALPRRRSGSKRQGRSPASDMRRRRR